MMAKTHTRRTAYAYAPVVQALESRRLLSAGGVFVTETDLISDSMPNETAFKNAWGISFGPNTPMWISENGSSQTQVFDPANAAAGPILTVKIPSDDPSGDPSAPTGQVFNGDTTAFLVNPANPNSAAKFIFAGEDGGISAWAGGASATIEVHQGAQGSVFKGLAIGKLNGASVIYATDFHNGMVDIFNGNWQPVNITGAFHDPKIPSGFAPFNIQSVGGNLVVTYAKQDADAHDDVPGAGNGFVDVYSASGVLLDRFQHTGLLNSPWGVAQVPVGSWGNISGDILVGQFGSGHIAVYRPDGHFEGPLQGANGKPVTIDGLWALTFGGGGAKNGDPNTLYFSAGPNGEADGLFGKLTVGFHNDNDHGPGNKGHDHDDDGGSDDGDMDILDKIFADLKH